MKPSALDKGVQYGPLNLWLPNMPQRGINFFVSQHEKVSTFAKAGGFTVVSKLKLCIRMFGYVWLRRGAHACFNIYEKASWRSGTLPNALIL